MSTERARTHTTMFERRFHALVTGAVLITIGVVLSLVVAANPDDPLVQPLDDRWLEWMVDVRTAWLVDLSKGMSFLGGPWVTAPLRIGVALALAWRRRWIQLTAFLGAVITSELCIGPLKTLVDRPRPPGGLIESHSASFPSGHAIAGAVTAFGLVVVLLPASPKRLFWIGVAAAFAAAMALSRTVLAVHWLTDVIAGGCLGTGFALMWPAALELGRESLRSPPMAAPRPAQPRSAQPHVVLVGLMGAGKSTVGRALAEHLRRPFVDVDLAIEGQTGQTVRELWESGGEAAYRALERDTVLATLAGADPLVLAAPGGVVLDESVRIALSAPDVVVVWLRGDVDVIASRVRPGDHRPLLGEHPAEVLATLAQARVPRYAEVAKVVVDIDGLGPDAVTEQVLAGLADRGVEPVSPH